MSDNPKNDASATIMPHLVRWHEGKRPYQLRVEGEALVLWGPKDVLADRLRLARLVYEAAEKRLASVPSPDAEVHLPIIDVIP